MSLFGVNLDTVEEISQSFKHPGAGAYVMRVVNAEHKPEKQYVQLTLDFAQGEFKNYGEDTETRTGFTFGYVTSYLSYKPAALGFLKHNVKVLDACNPKANIYSRFNNGDISCLNRALVGIVVGEEEYINKKGVVATKLTLPTLITLDDVKNGNYKVPAKVEIAKQENNMPASAPVPSVAEDEEIPF